MNSYFDDLYNDVYEYAYDTIMENKTASNRGGANTKNVNPKIKKKIKHKKRKLLLLITAMIAAFIFIKNKFTPDVIKYSYRMDYDEIKGQLNSGSYKQGDSAYNTLSTKYNKSDIDIPYCKEMIKKLKSDKNRIAELDDDLEAFQSLKALLVIEKRLKKPMTKLLDSKYLTPIMKRRIENAHLALNYDELYPVEEEE